MNPSIHSQKSWTPATAGVTRPPLVRLAMPVRKPQLMAVVMFLLLCLAGCLPPSGIDSSREDRLKQYESIVRWSEWDGAVTFLAPAYLEKHPVSRLEMERLNMFKVTAYNLRSFAVFDEGMTAVQTVEIKMFNNTHAIERTITDEQVWRYDPELKNWLLHSGLPDPTKRN